MSDSVRFCLTQRRRAPGVDHPLDTKSISVKLGEDAWKAELPEDANAYQFVRKLNIGNVTLQSLMECSDCNTRGAYYVTVEFVDRLHIPCAQALGMRPIVFTGSWTNQSSESSTLTPHSVCIFANPATVSRVPKVRLRNACRAKLLLGIHITIRKAGIII